jgi:pimeloyl-ACP methyl ester carboxylesterase
MWPEDMLPAELPSSRILTFGYDAYVTRLTMVSTNRISNHANDLLSALANVRGSERSHTPLIFVAHSLGGLVTKDALLKSRNSPDAHLRNIFQSTKGIAFMGTPHSGSSLATWAKLPAKCLGIFKQTNTNLLSVLETDSEVLVRIQDDFLSLLRSREIGSDAINITCFYETLPLPGVGLIVAQESAVLPGFNNISIHADHREMTRFSLKTDPGFTGVVGELKRWADDSNPQPQISVSVKLSDYEMKCLHLLAYADMESRLFAIDDPEGDTCQWLFSNAKYRKWCLRQELDLSHGLL